MWPGLALCLVTVVLTQPVTAAVARADATSDALVCLVPDRRQRVVDAAVLLGLAKAKSTADAIRTTGHGTVSLDTWRVKDPAGFSNACAAVVAAVRVEGGAAKPSGGSGWATILPLLIGALLTLVTTVVTGGWRERVTEARRQGRLMREAKGQFVTAVDDFLTAVADERVRVPASGTLDAPRSQLLHTLNGLPGVADSARLRGVRDALTTGALGAGLTQDWARPEQRNADNARYAEIRTSLYDAEAALEAEVRARETPIRSAMSRLVRRNSPGEATS